MQPTGNTPSNNAGKARMLDHTTDAAVLLTGRTLEAAFASGLEAMNQILLPEFCRNRKPGDCHLAVEVHSPDPTALLVDFLSECLALTYIHKVLFCQVRFEEINPTHVRAHLSGSRFGSFENEIKAVTYHGANLRQNKKGLWETPLLFDL